MSTKQKTSLDATIDFNRRVKAQHDRRTELIKVVKAKYQETGSGGKSGVRQYIESFLEVRHYDRDGNFYFNHLNVELLEQIVNGLKARASRSSARKDTKIVEDLAREEGE